MRFDGSQQAIAQHPWPLPDQYARLAGQPAIDLCHGAAQRLFAHEHGADFVLVFFQRCPDVAGMAPGNTEHGIDASLFQHLDDGVRGVAGVLQQRCGCHA